MSGLTYEELAAAYEMRHGFEKKIAWRRISNEFGITRDALFSAIKRLERNGLNRDINGKKPTTRPSALSQDMLEQVHKARRAGNSWPSIAEALGVKLGTVQGRYWRWKEANKVQREPKPSSDDE